LLVNTARKGQKEVGMHFYDQLIHKGRREGRKEGRVEGRVEGRAEGLREGRAKALLEQITARFGAVSDVVRERTLAAGEPALAHWSLQLLTAPTLDAVLEAAPSPRPAKKTAAPKRRAAPRKRARAGS
jgi:hypothetical protein